MRTLFLCLLLPALASAAPMEGDLGTLGAYHLSYTQTSKPLGSARHRVTLEVQVQRGDGPVRRQMLHNRRGQIEGFEVWRTGTQLHARYVGKTRGLTWQWKARTGRFGARKEGPLDAPPPPEAPSPKAAPAKAPSLKAPTPEAAPSDAFDEALSRGTLLLARALVKDDLRKQARVFEAVCALADAKARAGASNAAAALVYDLLRHPPNTRGAEGDLCLPRPLATAACVPLRGVSADGALACVNHLADEFPELTSRARAVIKRWRLRAHGESR